MGFVSSALRLRLDSSAEKERQVVTLLELIKIEQFFVRSLSHRDLGKRLGKLESKDRFFVRSLVVKAAYGYPLVLSKDRHLRPLRCLLPQLQPRQESLLKHLSEA